MGFIDLIAQTQNTNPSSREAAALLCSLSLNRLGFKSIRKEQEEK